MRITIGANGQMFDVTADNRVLTASELIELHRCMQHVFPCMVTLQEGVLRIELIQCCSFSLLVRLAGIHRVLLANRNFAGRDLEYELKGKRFMRCADGETVMRPDASMAVSA